MPVLTNIRQLLTCRAEGGQAALHAIERAALVWEGDTIVWVGPEAALPARFRAAERFDAGGCLVAPGLIDCHTHLAFGGWRADEFRMRCQGVSYLEIARQGGGIRRTVQQTRAASEDDLYRRCLRFLQEMALLGITTVEAKTGYGLSLEEELKLLRVYQRLQTHQPVRLIATLLAAHIVPPEYAERREAYLQLLMDELIPYVGSQHLADFCDVFVEETAFTVDEARQILERGKAFGLRPKLHVDQLHDGGGAQLAAEVGAISADHLEYAAEEGIRAMARAGVVAVALPLATLYLRQRPMNARRFIEAGVPVAVATDFNPGSAPTYHLPLAMTLACILCGLTPAEALKGATCYAARAIGRDHELGTLEPGKKADFILIDAASVDHWLYHFRPNAVQATFIGGQRFENYAVTG
ncbi:imidazolonepropionase [Rhodothermus profundi]|uniref:Imidazolonepropionase n=1 Tax=Rhodothermus profundi TaxID=633813 RepID=A0A1M6WV17_9BACT|nr:imidazolonepropionase [Rhodothermus profundi]SHK97429.1 imidazolonepropionase [Rhodothermus profundi]